MVLTYQDSEPHATSVWSVSCLGDLDSFPWHPVHWPLPAALCQSLDVIKCFSALSVPLYLSQAGGREQLLVQVHLLTKYHLFICADVCIYIKMKYIFIKDIDVCIQSFKENMHLDKYMA